METEKQYNRLRQHGCEVIGSTGGDMRRSLQERWKRATVYVYMDE